MKILTAIALILVAAPAHATAIPRSMTEFQTLYSDTADELKARGFKPTTICPNGLCGDVLAGETSPGHYVGVFNVKLHDGASLREVCSGSMEARLCAFSDGRTVVQKHAADKWINFRTLGWRYRRPGDPHERGQDNRWSPVALP